MNKQKKEEKLEQEKIKRKEGRKGNKMDRWVGNVCGSYNMAMYLGIFLQYGH